LQRNPIFDDNGIAKRQTEALSRIITPGNVNFPKPPERPKLPQTTHLACAVLNLHSDSPMRWLEQVDEHLDEILIDHAHCEHKAAATAMSLIGAYIENRQLCHEMTRIVAEELEHFHLVLALLERRKIRFRKLPPGNYGRHLNALVSPNEPGRAVDRLLIGALIEARSCERFSLLAKRVTDRELADFYASLFESEARHHTTYVKLARDYASETVVKQRLAELAAAEAAIIAIGHEFPRMHS
jgi:tRNA 2-(methylsulfanyl)-N6-isopentenyladenosine37 hydroxylase